MHVLIMIKGFGLQGNLVYEIYFVGCHNKALHVKRYYIYYSTILHLLHALYLTIISGSFLYSCGIIGVFSHPSSFEVISLLDEVPLLMIKNCSTFSTYLYINTVSFLSYLIWYFCTLFSVSI